MLKYLKLVTSQISLNFLDISPLSLLNFIGRRKFQQQLVEGKKKKKFNISNPFDICVNFDFNQIHIFLLLVFIYSSIFGTTGVEKDI